MLTIEIKAPRYIRWSAMWRSFHRLNNRVAVTNKYPNGKISCKEYWANGKRHRDPLVGPAYTRWHPNGQLWYKEYRVNNRFHRDPLEGPAVRVWNDNGKLYRKEYRVNGVLHRDPE